jgi:hypothetical protein
MKIKNKKCKGEKKTRMKYTYVIAMMVISFALTYIMFWLMVANNSDYYPSKSWFFQAAFMGSFMGFAELSMMKWMDFHQEPQMSRNKEKHGRDEFWMGVLLVASAFFAYMIRRQKGTDSKEEFYKEMIPHHSMAVRMIDETRKNKVARNDVEFQHFLSHILQAQTHEIHYMKKQLSQNQSEQSEKET